MTAPASRAALDSALSRLRGGEVVSVPPCTHGYQGYVEIETCAICADLEAAEDEALRAAAREALTVLTRLADSAHRWAGRDVPVGIVAEIDSAKARLAGVLAMVAAPEGEKEGEHG